MEVHASLKAEELFFVGPVGITNSMVMAWIAMAFLVFVGWRGGRSPALVPSGIQNCVEFVIEFLYNAVISTAGPQGRRCFPLFASIFLFILTANYMALLPGVGTISWHNPKAHGEMAKPHAFVSVAEAAEADGHRPGGDNAAEKADHHEAPTVPLFRAANADLNMTLAMGLIAFLFVHASGVAAHGFGGHLKEIATPWFLTPIKVMIEGFLPISLSMRLFGNVFGGEMLMAVMNWPIVAVPFMFMELLFGFIQAVIFGMLMLIFTALATYIPPGHGGHDHEESKEHIQNIEVKDKQSLVLVA